MMKIAIDEDKCIGCGACAATCPKAFVLKDGRAHVKDEADCAKAAEAGCPVGAIKVKD